MTPADRWWLAYCALGAALIIRAPSWGWAIVVLFLWTTVLSDVWSTVGSWLSARRKAKARDAERNSTMTDYIAKARANKTMIVPTAAKTDAVTVADLPKVPGRDAHSGYRAVSTTENLRAAILKSITDWENSGGGGV